VNKVCPSCRGLWLENANIASCVFNQYGKSALERFGLPVLLKTDIKIQERWLCVAQGESGMLLFVGLRWMKGYWNREEATVKPGRKMVFKYRDIAMATSRWFIYKL